MQEEAVEIPNLDLIYCNPCSFFIAPFDSYLKQHKDNEIALHMKKLIKEELAVSATANAQLAVKEENFVSRVHLNELIQKETKKNTSKLLVEINTL